MKIFDLNKSPVSDYTRPTLNPEQSTLNPNRPDLLFNLAEIKEEVIGVLTTECQISQEDLKKIKKIDNITEILLFFRRCPYKNESKTTLSMVTGSEKKNSNLQLLKQIEELKKDLGQKKDVIIQLTKGYTEARLCFEEDSKQKEDTIKKLKKQISKINSENEILTRKLAQLKKVQKKSHQIKIDRMQNKKEGSTDSRKSDYQELKDMLEIMSSKIIDLEKDQSMVCSAGISTRRLRSSLVEPQRSSYEQRRKSNNANSFEVRYDGKRSYHDQNISHLGVSELQKQVKQLRENQSKLLDKICQRDQMITNLMQIAEEGVKK